MFFQFLSPRALTSLSIPSSCLTLGLPLLLVPSTLASRIFFQCGL
jgi:hypothetical protein